MPALNFQKQFAAKIERGANRCTIRAPRQREIRAGDALHLFTGMRTKTCEKLKLTICREVAKIEIARDTHRESTIIKINNRALNKEEALRLARRDGHANLDRFTAFFTTTHGLPFHGILISW